MLPASISWQVLPGCSGFQTSMACLKESCADSSQQRGLAGPEQIQRSSFQKSDTGNNSFKALCYGFPYLPEEKK